MSFNNREYSNTREDSSIHKLKETCRQIYFAFTQVTNIKRGQLANHRPLLSIAGACLAVVVRRITGQALVPYTFTETSTAVNIAKNTYSGRALECPGEFHHSLLLPSVRPTEVSFVPTGVRSVCQPPYLAFFNLHLREQDALTYRRYFRLYQLSLKFASIQVSLLVN